jgi:ribonuclease BN (tRNA processing enzyme)
LIDAGTGAARLLAQPDLPDGVDRLDVVLTHFHLDHVGGLFYLASLDLPIVIWGGGEVLEGIPTADLVHRLLDSPFAPSGFVRTFETVHELGPGGARVGAFGVTARVQPKHGNPTLALRLEDAVAWCTDTAYDPENVEHVRGVEVLFHEAFHAADETDDPGHTAAGEAARLAAEAGVGRLVLIHIDPEHDDDDALLDSARPHFASTEVAVDRMEIEA